MKEMSINDDIRLTDVDAPETDFMAVRPWRDGSIEFVIIDTVNDGDARFTSISKTDAIALAHKLMDWA